MLYKTSHTDSKNIVNNKKAFYNYFIEKTVEAGLILEGWEVKSLREKKVDFSNSYLSYNKGEIYLIGVNIQPFSKSSSYVLCSPIRKRKVLLNKKEIYILYGKYKIKGYTLVALSLYWKKSWCKLKIGIAKGKTMKDKREAKKKRDWNIRKKRIIKNF